MAFSTSRKANRSDRSRGELSVGIFSIASFGQALDTISTLTRRPPKNGRKQMRTTSTLVGLTLLALAATARAEEAAPAPATAAPPAGDVVAAPVPMPAVGEAEALPQAGARHRKLQLGLSFLPMAMGKYTYSDTFDTTATSDAYFAYGIGLSVSYEVLLPGLYVGFAPQAILNLQPKPSDADYVAAMKEYDAMARLAYLLPLADTITVYAEGLGGYSLILPSDGGAASKGLVLAFGAGVAVDMTDRFFINLGAGYQMGYQNQTSGIHQLQMRANYVRVAMGGGVKF
jgi:hypothetical protein